MLRRAPVSPPRPRQPAWAAFLKLALPSLVALSFGHQCAAAAFTWSGAAPNIGVVNNSNWGNLFNWQGAQVPDNNGTADITIPDTPRDNSNVNDPFSIKSLTFEGPGTYSVNGDALTLNDITHNGTRTSTFNNAITVSGSGALWRAGSGAMTFNNAIGGFNSLTLEAPHAITFGGSVANTLTGTVIISEGTLVLAKSVFNGAINNILQIHGATARWDASDQVSDLLTSQVSVTSGGVANFNGKNETVGQLTLVGGAHVQSTGGALAIAGQLGLQDSSELDLGAGELELRTSVVRSGSSASTSRITAGTITLNKTQAIFFTDSSSATVELEVSGPIVGAFPAAFLDKTGGGALRLKGASTYQGGTTVEAGALIVDNTTGSGTGTGSVTVGTGAFLTGDGAISGSVLMQNAAAISPQASTGFAIGSLTVGALSMNTTSEFQVQFNQALPVTSRRDVLTVNGSATLNGNLVLQNLNASVFPDAATTFSVLTASTLSGSFANAANGARLATIDGTGSFIVNYGPASAFDPKQVVLSNFLTTQITGDFDNDGDVDGRDFLLWQRGGSPSPMSTVDLNAWRSNFGAQSAAAARSIPEPAAGTVVLITLSLATHCRCRMGRTRSPLA